MNTRPVKQRNTTPNAYPLEHLAKNKVLIAISLALGLSACGGGDNSAQTPTAVQTLAANTTTELKTGYLYDSPVHGVEYRACNAAGQDCVNGITGLEGEFNYREGDSVEFSLGGLSLGRVAGQNLVTPNTLAQGNAQQSAQIAQLLQTLDEDQEPTNGLVITQQTRQLAAKAYSQKTSLHTQDNASVIQRIQPGASLIPQAQAVAQTAGATRLELLSKANSDIAKAILGQKFYPIDGVSMNQEVLDSIMYRRLQLAIHYKQRRIYNATFQDLVDRLDGIQDQRNINQATIEVAKSMADVALLAQDMNGLDLNNARVSAATLTALGGWFFSFSSSVVGLGDAVLSGDDRALIGGEEASDVVKGYSNALYGLVTKNPSAVVGGAKDAVKSEFGEPQKRAAEAFGAITECIADFGDPGSIPIADAAGCLANATELAAKGLNDGIGAFMLIGLNKEMQTHNAILAYLDAYYLSAGRYDFMSQNFGVPLNLENAATYFDKKADHFLFWGGIDKAYFISEVTRLMAENTLTSNFYSKKFGLSAKVPVQVVRQTSIPQDIYAGQRIGFTAQIGNVSGFSVKSIHWAVFGDADAQLTSDGANAYIRFAKESPNTKVIATVESLGPDGKIYTNSDPYPVLVRPKLGDIQLSSARGYDLSARTLTIGDSVSMAFKNLTPEVNHVRLDLWGERKIKLNELPGDDTQTTGFTYKVQADDLGKRALIARYFDDQGALLGTDLIRITVQEAPAPSLSIHSVLLLPNGDIYISGSTDAILANLWIYWPDGVVSYITASGAWNYTYHPAQGASEGQSVLVVAKVGASTNKSKQRATLVKGTLPTGKLNDTGIVTCGTPSTAGTQSNSLECTDPAAATPAQQDASHGRDKLAQQGQLTKIGGSTPNNGKANGFDFTKIGSNGQPLAIQNAAWNNEGNESAGTSWSCVQDNVTGLLWENKTDHANPDFRDQDYTYSWYNSNPATNGGSAGTENGGACHTAGRCDTAKYVADINAAGLCGHNDWRMPTRKELLGIVDLGRVGPSIDPSYFPTTPSATVCWSASPLAALADSAWYVNFGEGWDHWDYKNGNTSVRLVRGQ